MSDLYRLLLGVLCVWRITHLVQAEDGPWEVIVHIRRAAGDGIFGRLLDCFYCLSIWVAAPFSWWLGKTLEERILMWLAFSAGAILLERSTLHATDGPRKALYAEDPKEHEDGVLRTKTDIGRRERNSS